MSPPNSPGLAAQVYALQRTVGNQAVTQLLRGRGQHPQPEHDAVQGASSPASVQRLVVQRDVDSDDYNAGYQDGLAGNSSNPGPRDGDALEDYQQGYTVGSQQAQQTQTSSTASPPSSQASSESGSPPLVASPGPDDDPQSSDQSASQQPGQDQPAVQPDQLQPPPGDSCMDSPEWKRGFTDGLTGAAPTPVAPSPDLTTEYEGGYQAGQAEAESGVGPEAPTLPSQTVSTKMVEVPGSDPKAIPASFDPLGLVGYKVSLSDDAPCLDTPPIDCGAFYLHMSMFLKGELAVLSDAPVSLDEEGLEVEAKNAVGGWEQSISVSLSDEGLSLSDTFGSEFAQTSAPHLENGALVYEGKVTPHAEFDTRLGKLSLEEEVGFRFEVRAFPKGSEVPIEDAETASDWWAEHGPAIDQQQVAQVGTVAAETGFAALLVRALIILCVAAP